MSKCVKRATLTGGSITSALSEVMKALDSTNLCIGNQHHKYHSLHWRSQVTDDAQALHVFFFLFSVRGAGWGHALLVNFCILEIGSYSDCS